MTKIVLTGRLRVGKDFVAKAVDARIIGFADPLYEMGRYFLGHGPEEKDTASGLREFYQQIGNWGRGEVNKENPLSVQRAIWTTWAKRLGPSIVPYVNWELYGQPNSGIWVDALLRRAVQLNVLRLAVSNCRFDDEFKRLTGDGFDHWHVMCGKQTYVERLAQVGLTLQSPELRHSSEKLADALDQSVVNTVRTQPTGPKLKVVWNDARPAPSNRFATIDELKQYLNEYEQRTNSTTAAADTSAGGCDGGQTQSAATAGTAENRDA
jgi:hypothetical protein